jgi:multidrug efflux pump
VRIADVAKVELGAEEADQMAKYNDRPSVYLGVWPLVGANEIDVAEGLEARDGAAMRPALPADIDMNLAYDGTVFMRDALTEISKTLLETILIVGLVVFLFLGSIRTALVPLVAMPVSLIGAAIVMAAFGFSLNLLTILAIVLSVGLVVDDAIVVVENVERHVRQGKTRMQAALEAARELLGPIVAMTITLAAVYTPIGFQGGMTGALFLEFAITLAAAVLVSGFVAITLSPVMSAYDGAPARQGVVADAPGRSRLRRWLRRLYERMLDGALAIRWAIVAVAVAVADGGLAALLARVANWRRSRTRATSACSSTPRPTRRSKPSTLRRGKSSRRCKLCPRPSSCGRWSPTGAASAAWSTRTGRSARARPRRPVGELYYAVSQIPGLRVFPRLDPPLPTPGSTTSNSCCRAARRSTRCSTRRWPSSAPGWQSGKFLYVDTDLKIDRPRRACASTASASPTWAWTSRRRPRARRAARRRLRQPLQLLRPQLQGHPADRPSRRATVGPLLDLKIKTPAGDLVPVSAFTTIEASAQPRTLNRFQQRNAVKIFGGVQPGVTKEEGLEVLEHAAAAVAKAPA